LESGAGETALAAAPVRETVVLTEDGDVADLPPDALLTSSLSVKVEDAFGRPIVDAEVLLRAGFPGRREVPVPFVDFAAEAVADARAVATFAVPPIGVYTARASSPGFAEDELGPIVPGDEVTLRLDAGETLSGVVTDASTEAPLEGAV